MTDFGVAKIVIQSGDVAAHMEKKLASILPKVTATHDTSATDGLSTIDLSIAENLLIRDELLAFCKGAIANNLKPEVRKDASWLSRALTE